MKRARGDAGFSLLELLLALSLGLVLSAVALQSLLADGQRSQRLGQQFRQRSEQRRLLALIESDALTATALSADPDPQISLCSLAGREPVLQLTTTAGVITYSRGGVPQQHLARRGGDALWSGLRPRWPFVGWGGPKPGGARSAAAR